MICAAPCSPCTRTRINNERNDRKNKNIFRVAKKRESFAQFFLSPIYQICFYNFRLASPRPVLPSTFLLTFLMKTNTYFVKLHQLSLFRGISTRIGNNFEINEKNYQELGWNITASLNGSFRKQCGGSFPVSLQSCLSLHAVTVNLFLFSDKQFLTLWNWSFSIKFSAKVLSWKMRKGIYRGQGGLCIHQPWSTESFHHFFTSRQICMNSFCFTVRASEGTTDFWSETNEACFSISRVMCLSWSIHPSQQCEINHSCIQTYPNLLFLSCFNPLTHRMLLSTHCLIILHKNICAHVWSLWRRIWWWWRNMYYHLVLNGRLESSWIMILADAFNQDRGHQIMNKQRQSCTHLKHYTAYLVDTLSDCIRCTR